MDDQWYPIASRIRSERERLGLSTTQLAKGLEVSRTTIHNWEGGKPIPIERCASLAEVLGIDHAELLSLHPHSTSLHLGPDHSNPIDAGRLLKVGIATITLIIVGTMFFTWSTARADCLQVGAGGGSLLGPFHSAYSRYGGESVLGCAINEVHKWGPGYVQDFEGGSSERSVLMTSNGTNVFYLGGDMWWDYVNIADGATPDVVGVVASEVLQCGSAVVQLLEGGFAGPGALVSNASSDQFVWLSGNVWIAYSRTGGPLGSLGLPTSNSMVRDANGVSADFQHGRIVHTYGNGVSIEPSPGDSEVFSTESCQPVSTTGD